MDQLTKEAFFKLHAYTDQAAAKASTIGGFYHAGRVYVKGPAFDAYFSRAALHSTKNSVHGQLYQLIKDVVAAKKAANPTEAQKVLTHYGQVDIVNDFGGVDFFADATDVFEAGQP